MMAGKAGEKDKEADEEEKGLKLPARRPARRSERRSRQEERARYQQQQVQQGVGDEELKNSGSIGAARIRASSSSSSSTDETTKTTNAVYRTQTHESATLSTTTPPNILLASRNKNADVSNLHTVASTATTTTDVTAFHVRDNPLASDAETIDASNKDDDTDNHTTEVERDALADDTQQCATSNVKHEVLQRLRTLSVDVGSPASEYLPPSSEHAFEDASSPEVKRILLDKLRTSTTSIAASTEDAWSRSPLPGYIESKDDLSVTTSPRSPSTGEEENDSDSTDAPSPQASHVRPTSAPPVRLVSRLRRLLRTAADDGDSFNRAIRTGSTTSSMLTEIIQRNNDLLDANLNPNIEVNAVIDALSPSADLAKVAAAPHVMRWSGPRDTTTRVTTNGWRLPQVLPRAGHTMLPSTCGTWIVALGGCIDDSLDSGCWQYDTRCRCWWERDVLVEYEREDDHDAMAVEEMDDNVHVDSGEAGSESSSETTHLGSLSFHSLNEMMTLAGSCGVMLFGYTGMRTVSQVALVLGLNLAPTVPVTMRVVKTRLDNGTMVEPLSRSLHTATAISGHKLFVFGGWHKDDVGILSQRLHESCAIYERAEVVDDDTDEDDDRRGGGHGYFLSDGWVLDTVRMTWLPCAFNSAENPSRRPGPRCGHTSVLIAGRVYVFGGETPHGASDQLHVYDWQQEMWSFEEHLHVVNGGGPRPSARSGHCAARLGSRMIIHGGFCGDGPSNETFIFDVTSLSWTEVDTSVGFGQLVHVDASNGTHTWTSGDTDEDDVEDEESLDNGEKDEHDGDNRNDVDKPDEAEDREESDDELSMGGGSDDDDGPSDTENDDDALVYAPQPRTGHASCVVGLRLYVHGGYTWDGSLSGELIALDASVIRTPDVQLSGSNLDAYTVEMTSPVPRDVRGVFQWFSSKRGAPFIAVKTACDINRYTPTVDDIGCVVGVSCSLMMGSSRLGPVAFLQSDEVRPDAMMLATAKMLLIRQEADFTNLTLLHRHGPQEQEEVGAAIRFSRTHIRVKVGEDVRVREPYLASFVVQLRSKPTELVLVLREGCRIAVRARTVQDRDLMTLVARGFWAIRSKVVI